MITPLRFWWCYQRRRRRIVNPLSPLILDLVQVLGVIDILLVTGRFRGVKIAQQRVSITVERLFAPSAKGGNTIKFVLFCSTIIIVPKHRCPSCITCLLLLLVVRDILPKSIGKEVHRRNGECGSITTCSAYYSSRPNKLRMQ